jgi:glycosyltransferase involved in cell wall biosynthesis
MSHARQTIGPTGPTSPTRSSSPASRLRRRPDPKNRLRILVAGLRALPEAEGGVERHAEALYPRLVSLGCHVEVAVRTPFCSAQPLPSWKGVKLKRIWSPRMCGLEPLVHTLLVTLYAAVTRPDILHIHAVGPALLAPLARAFGLTVVVTHHGPDYDREKWGRFARIVLRLGEAAGMRFANRRIVISQLISRMVADKFGADTAVIPNGVQSDPVEQSTQVLEQLGLTPRRYVLQVSRFVPEKRQLDLIEAFAAARLDDWHLVLVGDADGAGSYGREAAARAAQVPNVVLTGFRTGAELRQLYSHAGLFVLPSSHEGLPLVILEALSFGLRVLASDIPANREVGLASDQYYPTGDVAALGRRLDHFARNGITDREAHRIRRWVAARYDWDEIAERTLDVYQGGNGSRSYPAPV